MKIKYIMNIFERESDDFKKIKHDGSRLEKYFNEHVKHSCKVELSDCIPVMNGGIADWSAIPSDDDEITIIRKIPTFRFGE